MKQLFKSLMFVAAAATLFAGCSKDNNEDQIPEAPSMVWEGNDLDAVHEITDVMSIQVKIMIPAGLQKLQLEIDSPALTPQMLGAVGLAPQMDLANPDNKNMEDALKSLNLPAGTSIKGSTEQVFNISSLVPMIKAIYHENSDHKFKVTVTDAKNQSIAKTLTFHLTGPTNVTYNNDADLWKNTATLTATVRIDGEVKVEYRKKGTTDWQSTTTTKKDDITYTATIAPTWKAEGKHATGVDQFSLDNTKGIFAGNIYEYRLTVAGNEIDKKEFTAPAGQTIPGGDMNTWSKYIGYQPEWVGDPIYDAHKTFYPNESIDNQFWGNGNNAFAQTLCQPDSLSLTNYAAKLEGNLVMGSIFAAGNLFFGVFEMAGMAGYARFGKIYEFTARPTALKVRIKTTINTISNISEELTPPNGVKIGDTDPSRIFVCITNWDNQHSVYSGMGVTLATLNAFDPVSDTTEPAEGKVIAYGSKMFTTSISNWQELTIPIIYKDKVAKPETGKFSLVISGASSAYGDYLCGSEKNALVIDYFEWVY